MGNWVHVASSFSNPTHGTNHHDLRAHLTKLHGTKAAAQAVEAEDHDQRPQHVAKAFEKGEIERMAASITQAQRDKIKAAMPVGMIQKTLHDHGFTRIYDGDHVASYQRGGDGTRPTRIEVYKLRNRQRRDQPQDAHWDHWDSNSVHTIKTGKTHVTLATHLKSLGIPKGKTESKLDDPATRMHISLRSRGWAPEPRDSHSWYWKHPMLPHHKVITWPDGGWQHAVPRGLQHMGLPHDDFDSYLDKLQPGKGWTEDRMVAEQPVGYTVGRMLMCPTCATKLIPDLKTKLWSDTKASPMFKVNLHPYNQNCHGCGGVIHKGAEGWAQLYDAPDKESPRRVGHSFEAVDKNAIRDEIPRAMVKHVLHKHGWHQDTAGIKFPNDFWHDLHGGIMVYRTGAWHHTNSTANASSFTRGHGHEELRAHLQKLDAKVADRYPKQESEDRPAFGGDLSTITRMLNQHGYGPHKEGHGQLDKDAGHHRFAKAGTKHMIQVTVGRPTTVGDIAQDDRYSRHHVGPAKAYQRIPKGLRDKLATFAGPHWYCYDGETGEVHKSNWGHAALAAHLEGHHKYENVDAIRAALPKAMLHRVLSTHGWKNTNVDDDEHPMTSWHKADAREGSHMMLCKPDGHWVHNYSPSYRRQYQVVKRGFGHQDLRKHVTDVDLHTRAAKMYFTRSEATVHETGWEQPDQDPSFDERQQMVRALVHGEMHKHGWHEHPNHPSAEKGEKIHFDHLSEPKRMLSVMHYPNKETVWRMYHRVGKTDAFALHTTGTNYHGIMPHLAPQSDVGPTTSLRRKVKTAEDLIADVQTLEATFRAGTQGTVAGNLRKSVASRGAGQGGLPIYGAQLHAYQVGSAQIHHQRVKARKARRPLVKAGRKARRRLYSS